VEILMSVICRHLIYHNIQVMEPFHSADDIALEEHFEIHIPNQQPEQVHVKSGLPHNDSGDDIPPKVHMCFDSLDDVKQFYKNYSIRSGFGIRTSTSARGEDNEINYIKLVCSREGNYMSAIPPELKTVPTKAKQCKASITAAKKDGQWFIRSIVTDHSHDISPKKSRLIRGNRKVDMHSRQTVETNDDAGVRINKSFRSLVSEAGGYEHVNFIERDVRNYIGQQRRSLCKDGDGQTLLRHFSKMRELNNDFFFEIDMDEDNRICNVFWADARSRAASEDFGDVVSFDTTYLTNKYDMPFAPFVGVNHHGHSILLGCGLVSAEDTRSFVWIFELWLRCMYNKPPEGIVTDQCKAMLNAIREVFPNTKHRWCLWHIMKKVPEKLQGYTNYKSIKTELKRLVYDSITMGEFELGWHAFIGQYDLTTNDWLTTLFDERHHWVPCYLKSQFWAGMSTTQRSEGLNAFFDGFINSGTTL